jgi:hypothetical protein
MRSHATWLAFACAAVTTVAACGGDARLGTIALASGVDAQGRPAAAATVFARGATVYASVELQDTYKGLPTRATWRRGEETLLTENRAVPRDAGLMDPVFLVFTLETKGDWAPGAYRFEVFVPDQGTTLREFRLE